VARFEDYGPLPPRRAPPPATGSQKRVRLARSEPWEAFAKFCQLGAQIQRAEQGDGWMRGR
jgi:hypothetical protein